MRFSGRLFGWTLVHKYTKDYLNCRDRLGNVIVFHTLEGQELSWDNRGNKGKDSGRSPKELPHLMNRALETQFQHKKRRRQMSEMSR